MIVGYVLDSIRTPEMGMQSDRGAYLIEPLLRNDYSNEKGCTWPLLRNVAVVTSNLPL
jgi:hypothetical protein